MTQRAPTRRSFLALGALLLALAAPTTPAQAQPTEEGRLFGMEFEFAGSGNRIVDFREMPWENYEKLMREVVTYYGGNPNEIKRVDFTKPTSNLELYPSGERPLFRAEWKDPKGRTWLIEPEYVSSTGLDGYEVVTPPLADPKEVEGVLERLKASGLVREGLKSGVHLTIDARDLIRSNGDARALTNLILMHENMEPMLRRVFNPVRGGGHANRFARSIAVDHEELLREIDALRPEERTKERLESLFNARNGREAAIHEVDPMNPDSNKKIWKYRSLNLAKALNINEMHNGNMGVVEFRMFDLHALQNPENHRLQAELYRAMFEKAKAMAEAGETVKYQPRANQPIGEDPSLYNTPQDPNEARAKARAMIEGLGLDPARFERLIEGNVAKPRYIPSEAEFRGLLDALPGGRVVHGEKAFTYGFELEGTGEGFARIARPKNAEVNARWDTMTDAEKYEHYRETVGSNRSSVPQHFDLDLQRFPWLDPNWKVEGTGNWEIRSLPFESIKEATDYMREVKRLTGKSGKGFHLHMRDNGVEWEKLEAKGSQFADWIERSSNWVWLERARRLGTMTSMKSWSNARIKTAEIEALSNVKSSQRATVRVTVPSNKEYIDIEIRGFTKYVDDIERLGKIYTEGLRTYNFGPWSHKANPLAYNGQGDAPESLRFVDHMERYLRNVEGREMTPEMRKVVDGLQHGYSDKAVGRARTYSTNVATALLPWDKETSISESMRRDMKFAREGYLRSLRGMANKVMSGDFGLDLSVANEKALERHLGLSEAEAKALVEYRASGGKLETAEDLARALTRGAEGARLSRLAAVDLAETNLNREVVRERLGISAEAAETLSNYRNSMDAIEAMEKAGVAEADILRMIDRSGALDLFSAEATAEKISERTGLSLNKAKKIVAFRDAHELNSVNDLRKAGLPEAKANALMSSGLNLATATEAELRNAGLTELQARNVVNYRGENRLGRLHNWGGYEANTAAKQLRDAGILSEADAERIDLTRNVNLETAKAEDLQKRFGMNAETAEKLLWLRDAHKLDAEGLKAAGLSEAEAKRVLSAAEQLDPKTTSLERMAERTGMSEADLVKALRADGVSLTNASEADLRSRLGLTEAEAKKLIEARTNGNALNTEAKLVEAGLSEAKAKAAFELAKGVNFSDATLEDLRRVGLSEAEAKKLVDAREKARSAPELDYNEITRQVRYKTKKWARETELSEALLRSLLPRPNPNTYTVAPEGVANEGTGFSRTRPGRGPVEASKVSYETVSSIFESIREGAALRLAERIGEGKAANNSELVRASEAGIESLRGLKLEIVETNSILAEIKEGTVRVSSGLFNQIYARGTVLPPAERGVFRMRVLALILGHETAHGVGIKVERVADMESIKIVEKSRMGAAGAVTSAEIKGTLDVFERPLGYSRVDNFFNRLRNLFRYGTTRGRRANMERTAAGEVDKLAKYRRADGTLKWSELTRDRALREGTGVAHFALALFLKEVAVVAATGDRARIEEFFDGLMTTDFYTHYGMFVAGARLGEVAYMKYLSRYIKPKFVNGLLKTNLVLAAGMALPMIVTGHFEGKAFAISLGSLGLSSSLVQGGAKSIRWVMTLKKARETGTLARVGMAGGRLARFGGWFYTAAELAVVLYVAEKIDVAVNEYLDLKKARETLGEAGVKFVEAMNDPNASAEDVKAAADEYHGAWINYRDFLYGPLHVDEAMLADRLEGVARRAKIKADESKAAVDRIKAMPSLRRNIESRYGSVEAYAAHLTREAEKEIEADVNKYVDSYNLNRKKHLDEVYFSNKRTDPFMAGLEHRDWLLNGGETGASNDPWGRRSDTFANWGRDRARSAFAESMGGASKNRLQAYVDEGSVYESMAALARDRGRDDLAEELDKRRQIVNALAAADEALIKGNGLIDTKAASGLSAKIRESSATGDGN